MKTIIFEKENGNDPIIVEVKVDIFAKNSQLIEPGFDTRFTGMEIKDTDQAIAAGINVNEMEHNWQGFVFLANSLDLGLRVTDLNESDTTPLVVRETPEA